MVCRGAAAPRVWARQLSEVDAPHCDQRTGARARVHDPNGAAAQARVSLGSRRPQLYRRGRAGWKGGRDDARGGGRRACPSLIMQRVRAGEQLIITHHAADRHAAAGRIQPILLYVQWGGSLLGVFNIKTNNCLQCILFNIQLWTSEQDANTPLKCNSAFTAGNPILRTFVATLFKHFD